MATPDCANLLKLSIALIAIQRITAHDDDKNRGCFPDLCVELRLPRNSHTGGGPHVSDIDVLVSIVVEIEPARTHARPEFFDCDSVETATNVPSSLLR